MPDRMLRRAPVVLAVLAVALLLTHCNMPKTTIRSTVASDLERPIPAVFVAVQNADRPYLNPSALTINLVDAFQEAGLETEDATFDPLTLNEQPGITGARDASLPFALVVSFKGGKIDSRSTGLPSLANFEVDASLYDAQTEERVWRGVLDATESDQTETILSERIVGALQKDGVIPSVGEAAGDGE